MSLRERHDVTHMFPIDWAEVNKHRLSSLSIQLGKLYNLYENDPSYSPIKLIVRYNYEGKYTAEFQGYLKNEDSNNSRPIIIPKKWEDYGTKWFLRKLT